jgi:uncharacterized delta-60 repeat protein
VAARRVTAVALLFALGCAAPAAAEVAPGRVTFPVDGMGRHRGVDPRGLSVGVALPDRRMVLAGTDRSSRIVLAQLHADGSLDQTFGTGGLAHVGGAPFAPQSLQLLPRPDGSLVVVAGTGFGASAFLVASLSSDGVQDRSFGDGGLARPPVRWGCANCSPGSLAPDGGVVLSGRDDVPPAPSHGIVVRLTAAGDADAGFGSGGVAVLGAGGSGYTTAVLPTGAIAVLGQDADAAKLWRLTRAGVPDPAFNGGAPAALPGAFPWWFGLRARDDGGVDALGSGPGSAELVRYTATGSLDPAFGSGGVVTLSYGDGPAELLPAPGGADLVAAPPAIGPDVHPPALRVARVTSQGAVEAAKVVPIGFAGGLATVFAAHREPTVTPLDQSDFRPGRPFARADGSVVLPGAVGVVQYTGEGVGFEADRAAVAAVTSTFDLDPSFGGPARRARIAVRVTRQRAASATNARLLRIAVSARASGPGLCLLRVKAGGRVIAHSTAPVYASGPQRLPALLTTAGRRYLRSHRHRVRVTVTATFRDLVGSRASATAIGTLR